MIQYPDFYLRGARGDFALSVEGSTKLWRKELAYPDKFVKVNGEGRAEFELPVDERQIDHWVDTFNEMQKDGIPVPVPVGHTNDAEARRGTVRRMTKEINDKGKPALFCYIEFSKPEYADHFKHSDVSLYMPNEFTSGTGKTYHRPIRHVALTDYPVVPALGKFEQSYAFALSLASEEDQMGALVQLAKKMGVEVPEGADDAAAEQAIMQAWEAGGEGGGEGHEEPDSDDMGAEVSEGDDDMDDQEHFRENEDEEPEMGSPGDDPDPEILSEGEEGEEEYEEEDPNRSRRGRNNDPPPSMSFSFPKTMVNQLTRARTMEIDNLVKTRKINKRVADELKKSYCGVRQVEVALSHEMHTPGKTGDAFERTVAMLSLNSPIVNVGEQSGPQQHTDQLSEQPTVKDAQRRADEAKARRRR